MSRSGKQLKWGVILLVVGTGPLIAIVIAAKLGLTSDPDPNPIGPGMLAFLTFWPAVIMIANGLMDRKRQRNNQLAAPPPVETTLLNPDSPDHLPPREASNADQ